MDPKAYQAVAEDLWEENAPASHKVATAGTFGAGGLAAIIAWLRANGITFSKILASIGPIIQIIVSGGGNWQAIITALLALFFPAGSAPTVGAPAAP